jgi:hypothetical protein
MLNQKNKNNFRKTIYHNYISKQYLPYRDNNNTYPLKTLSLDDVEFSFLLEELDRRKGYIYIATNHINTYYKVGMTKQHPSKRLKSLNSAGVFYELNFVRVFPVPDIHIETYVHSNLIKIYPKSKYKEFFNLPLNLIENVIEEEIESFNEFLTTILPKHFFNLC